MRTTLLLRKLEEMLSAMLFFAPKDFVFFG